MQIDNNTTIGNPADADDVAYNNFRNTLPDNLKNTKDADTEGGDYRSRRYWELWGKPSSFDEGLKNGMFTKQEDGYHSSSVAYDKVNDVYEFMKAPNHPTIGKELEWYNSNDPEAVQFRKNYQLDKNGQYYRYVRRSPSNMFGL